ncbi:hypothetical protein A0U87_24035 [Sphingobium sp. MP9-4]|uniref:DGQHR domain-containing protein n=1 Tax=Sphingobium sp. MP9-4 TaxID=1761936 RepID=UPI0010CA7A44|nr:DGQHR domain-containing protein [Sphingobium sp. MP9-4]TKV40595.1 hypothetical protein A0U87_24035 [Sphingobium sp. MP9-4]
MTDKPSTLRYSVSLVTQGEHRFYSLTMPSDVLARTCYATTREEDALEGFQRVLDKKRAQDIADYIDAGLGTIPNSIVLSAQPEAEIQVLERGKTLQFVDAPRNFLIIDGQHRVFGFALAKSELRVPVIIFNGLSKAQESRMFIDINTKQRPVPNELLLDIKKLADYEDDQEKLLGKLFDIFNEAQDSPLLGMMSASSKRKGYISRVTFNHGVRPLLNLVSSLQTVEIYKILSGYIRSVIAAAQLQGKSISIVDPTTFRGIMLTFPAVAQRLQQLFGKEYSDQNFFEVVNPMFERASSAKIGKSGNSPKVLSQIFEEALKPKFTI